jgi:Tfp pilus assembly protein PilX
MEVLAMVLKSKMRRRVYEQAGQTLVLALIIMASLTITTAGAILFMTSNETSAGRDRQVVSALSAAEAGLSNGISYVVQNDATNNLGTYPANDTWLPTISTTIDGNSVQYKMKKSSTTDNSGPVPITTYYWTIDSAALNGSRVVREVQQQVKYVQGAHQDASQDYQYGLFVGAPPAGTNPPCLVNLSGDVTVTTNVYIGGNLCTNGGVNLKPKTAHTLSVYVAGYFKPTNSGSIGTAALPFSIARVKGGCFDKKGNNVICSNQTNVFADDLATTPFPNLLKPTVHGDTIYNAAPSWAGMCTNGFVLESSAYGSPTAMDQSVGVGNRAEELFPNSDYSCSVPKTDGTTATMSWNHTTNTFNIVGTMFIDGDITMNPTSGSDVNWTGNGSIYVNGVVSKGSNNNICGPPRPSSGPTGYGCQTTWDSAAITLTGTITAGSTSVSGLASTTGLQAGFFVTGNGIPTGATIASVVDANTVTLSTAAVGSGNVSLNFLRGNFGLVILNPANATNGYNASGNGELDMDMYIVSGFANNGGTVVTGSVVADGGTIGGGTGFLDPRTPPPDFPTTYDYPDIGWSANPSTWRELK